MEQLKGTEAESLSKMQELLLGRREEKMKYGIYARVSDDKKKSDGERRQDVNRQVQLLTEHMLLKGLKQANISVYIDDGKSAFREDWNSREAFKRLFNDCRRHFIQEVYVEDMTRFSRRLDLGLQWLKELGDLNVNLISLKEGELEVTSSNGWLKSSMMLMFAEWSSRVQGEKIRSGMRKAKNLGKHVGRPKKKRSIRYGN